MSRARLALADDYFVKTLMHVALRRARDCIGAGVNQRLKNGNVGQCFFWRKGGVEVEVRVVVSEYEEEGAPAEVAK